MTNLVTLLYAGIFALMAVALANYVLFIRLRSVGRPKWQANAAERVQANFVENVPISLVLLYLLEVSGVDRSVVHLCGGSLVVLRLLHAWGLARYEGANYPRLIGAQGTFLLMSVMAMMAIGIYFF